ncbi:Hypothetical protein GLP15_3627 [Giardia lamblia P15]|uniref:Uncharacterized protein n=1 Tax=Giardia intestinalis (strain P15) TaxID=658858 RepID=E1F679_GIAIA|nr:Hypothetical protein GLP15_3627 [Giardia lamblia P15]
MKTSRASQSWQNIMRLSQRRLITFLIGNRQYSICRPFFVSVLSNQFFFYLLLAFCTTSYIRPNDIFLKVTFPWGLHLFFTIIVLLQASFLIMGFVLSLVLHISLAKGNTNYQAARAKRLIFYFLTSIRLIYAFGSSFLLFYNAIQKRFILFICHLIIAILSIFYFIVFNYISLFYASTTFVLTPTQYLLTAIVPHIISFVMGPLYIVFLYFMSGLSNWMIASRCLHGFVFVFVMYSIIVNCVVPFCSFLTPIIIAILCLLSGLNLVGIVMTIISVPTNHFIIYTATILCWACSTFLLSYTFIIRKYRREQAAIVRLHNGDYSYTGVSLTPEMLYNSLLLFTSHIKHVAITDGRFYMALENICLCYIIALYNSLKTDSTANKISPRDCKCSPKQAHGCIAKCSKQKRLAYICLILDMLDCEILHALLDASKEEDSQSQEELYGVTASTNRDKRIVYEINLYLLEIFSLLMILKSIEHSLTNQPILLNSEERSEFNPKPQSHPKRNKVSIEVEELQKQHKAPFERYTYSYGQGDEVAKSSVLINVQQYRRSSPITPIEKEDPVTIDVSDMGYSDLNAPSPSASESGVQPRLISTTATEGKGHALNYLDDNIVCYTSTEISEQSRIPLRVYRHYNDTMHLTLNDRKKWLFCRPMLSICHLPRSFRDTLANSATDLKDCRSKLQWIVQQLSPQFLRDLVFESPELDLNTKSAWSLNALLETLLYSCCGFVLVKTNTKDLRPQLRRLFDPSRLFYLDDTPPQEMYKQQSISDNQSSTCENTETITSTATPLSIASPYLSITKDVSAIFNEQINPDVTPVSVMKQFHGVLKKLSRFKIIKYLGLDNIYDSISQCISDKENIIEIEHNYADILEFAPPTKYRYFANPKLTNTRPMNICSCMIINSVLGRILENADTCLTNIGRITKLSNSLKQDSYFSTFRLEELMVLCNKQNVLYQDIVEQAKWLYMTYPHCVTATHTLAWVYHELYNTIWPLNQLSIFPLISQVHPSLNNKELSNLNSSLFYSDYMGQCTSSTTSDSSNSDSLISSHNVAISPKDAPEEQYTKSSDVANESDIKQLLDSSVSSQQESIAHSDDPATGTFSTLSLSSFGQTGTKSVLVDHLSQAPLMQQDSCCESVRTVKNYIQNFILTQERSVQSFYISYTPEGSIVILPPCLSYCHYAVVDSPLSLQRCEHRTYADIKSAETSLMVSPVSINIINHMAILSTAFDTPAERDGRNRSRSRGGTKTKIKKGYRPWRNFFTTGFHDSLTPTKSYAKRFVRTLLNKHQDIIRSITVFNLENLAYAIASLLAFVVSLIIIKKANRVFMYNDLITEAASVFAAVVQADEIAFMKIYDSYSQRLATREPIDTLLTSKDLEELYYLSISNIYEEMSQKIYNLGLDLEQYAFSSIHPFFHVLKVSNKMVSFIPTPIPTRIYGTIVFQNPYKDMLICFPPPQALDRLSSWSINNHHLITKCIQSKIEGVRSSIYINIVPFIWNSMFTITTSSLLIQNFSTHLKVLLMALTGTVGFCLIFAFSSYNIFLVRLQNLSDLLLNLLSRTGARFDYRLLFAQFYFKERINFGCQNVKYTPTFEHLVSMHFEATTEKDLQPRGCFQQLFLEQQPKTETSSPSSDSSSNLLSGSNSACYTSSSLNNTRDNSIFKYRYRRLAKLYKAFSAQYDKPSAVWVISKVFVLLCMGLSMVLLYIFHSFPIISYTETGIGPYYASVIESMRYPEEDSKHMLYNTVWNDDISPIHIAPAYQTIGDVVKFEGCLQKAKNPAESQECFLAHDYIDNSDRIVYASPQWRLTWLRQNYALLQDLILDTLLVDLSISQHTSIDPADPETEPHKLYYTCSSAVKNPHLAPFVLDGDIRFADVTKKLIYLYTMSVRSPSYDYYSMIISQYSDLASKYVLFVLDYGASSSPPSTFKEHEYKAALLLPPFGVYKPMLNRQNLQKEIVGIKAFIEMQKNVYNNSFSILQPSYAELRGKNQCAELTAFHSMLLMNSIAKQRESTSINRQLDEKNITLEHLFSLFLLLSFVPIILLVLHYFSVPRANILEVVDSKKSHWIDLYSYRSLPQVFAVLASLVTAVIVTIVVVSFTQFFNNKVAVSHMTRIYISSSHLNSLGLQLLESLGNYNMQLASLEWDDINQAYKYNCEDIYVALQRPIMLNTRFHLVDAVENIKPFIDTDQMLELYYNIRHAAFSVNVALARMCTLPTEMFPEKAQQYTADTYLDEVFNFSKPVPDKKYSSYYEDYSLCAGPADCVDIYSYARLKALSDKDLHLYIKSISKGSNILLKNLLLFSHKVELTTNSLTRQILAVETRIDNFLVLMQRIISWLLVIHVILLVLLYIYLQFVPTRTGLAIFKIITTHRYSLALRFGLTVGSFTVLIFFLLISLLFSMFRVEVITTDGTKRWTETRLYNSLGNVFINSCLMNLTLATLQNTDLSYEEMHISELYTRIQNLNEYAKVAQSAANMLLTGFSYTNSTGIYDVKEILLNYTTSILIATEEVQKRIWDAANKVDQRIRLSDVYDRDDYLGIANLTLGDINKIMEGYASPVFEMRNIKLAVSIVQGVMIGAFLACATYTIIVAQKEISSILTILNTIPVADILSFKELSSGIFDTYGDMLSFAKLL